MTISLNNARTKLLAVAVAFICAVSFTKTWAQSEVVEPLSQAELEQILAPIALYPDSILSHILVAATYPLEVVQAERWIAQQPELKGQDAVEAADEFDWDPSVKAMVAFPEILKRMSQDLDWTQKLGDAFISDEERVLASIQELRVLAEEAGSLDKMDKVSVTRDDKIIVIEPRRREVVYVPYYDTRIVYGAWRWPHYQPVYWDYPYYAYGPYYDSYYAYNRSRYFYWGPSISLSFGFYSNAFHWHNYHIVRVSPRYYQPRRYYSRNDIIRHRHAQRWEYDQRRGHRHWYRNSDNHRDYRNQRDSFTREDFRVQRGPTQVRTAQEQIQDRLASQRSRETEPRPSSQIDMSRSRTISNASTSSSPIKPYAVPNPTRNAPISLPERISRVDDGQRINRTQPVAPQPITRPRAIEPSPQTNRSFSAPTQQPPIARPAPTAPQAISRPAATSRPVATERNAAPSRPAPGLRNERIRNQ